MTPTGLDTTSPNLCSILAEGASLVLALRAQETMVFLKCNATTHDSLGVVEVDMTTADKVLSNPAYDFAGTLSYTCLIEPLKFQRAVERALLLFPVIAGTVNLEAQKLILSNTGVFFEHASCNEEIDDAKFQIEKLYSKTLAESHLEKGTNCSLRLTTFKRATLLDFRFRHACGDGDTFFAFLHTTSEAYESLALSRTASRLVRNPLGGWPACNLPDLLSKGRLEGTCIQDVNEAQVKELQENIGRTINSMTFMSKMYSKSQLATLKAKALATKPADVEYISTMDVALSQWYKFLNTKIRWSKDNPCPFETFELMFIVNFRKRFPHLWEENLVGNHFCGMSACFTPQMWSSCTPGELAAVIRRAINRLNIEYLCIEEAWKSERKMGTYECVQVMRAWDETNADNMAGGIASDWTKFPIFESKFEGQAPQKFDLDPSGLVIPWMTVITQTTDGGINMSCKVPDEFVSKFDSTEVM
mmetsp:Transcript_11153/g.38755  ORF Transcript_11153/g.38755 Transcript_11153/m.38755 type:complete len:474 (+) Transcript_11153:468-1889(+)